MFDLVVVEDAGWDPAFGGQPFEEVYPFRPFPIGGGADLAFVGFDGDGELVFGDEVEGAFAEGRVYTGEDVVLFRDVEGRGEVGEFAVLSCQGARGGWRKKLMGAVEFIAVGGFALRGVLGST